ncbi:SDR family NAD(P)-dependent oxidoreductase [Paenibacillus athensensis]|uniref:Short-chain dehydrogenase n=1 Tax=Paenibacillus athensensis TaxID=1967502 RepID=A0A4Y8Q063_9BACL|nr:SDR family NAD(P)-dependent oxidoreductase [Paenibacillus athensensis]MCD1261115.1 SDR family NAD(P)-dependent oxidoreductase [Paenibacillus athensensis]
MHIFISGASRGLGLALALAAAERGHTVWAGVRDPAGMAAACEQYQGLIRPVALDVTSEASIAAAAGALAAQGVKLDAIVNNAAVLLGREAAIEELELGELQASFTVNLFGPLLVVKHVLPLVAERRTAVIVNISSEAGSTAGAYGGDYPYALSKAGLNYFSLQLRAYLREAGTKVYAVHPGWIQTDMGGAAAPGDPAEAAAGILRLIENRDVQGEAVFVDHTGAPLPL